jgi:hypothetical protein
MAGTLTAEITEAILPVPGRSFQTRAIIRLGERSQKDLAFFHAAFWLR